MSQPKYPISFPWNTRQWPDIKAKLTRDINSIIDMDSLMVTLSPTLTMKCVTTLFNEYQRETPGAITPETVVKEVFPAIISLVTRGPKTFKSPIIPLILPPGMDAVNVSYTQTQAATIIACMWFNLFDHNATSGRAIPNLQHMFLHPNLPAFAAILQYFYKYSQIQVHDRDIVYRRERRRPVPVDDNGSMIAPLTIGDDQTDQLDPVVNNYQLYPCKSLVGESLFRSQLTADEIVLCARPELFVLSYICPMLTDSEVIAVLGAEQFSTIIGTGSMARYAGPYELSDNLQIVQNSKLKLIKTTTILADASDSSVGVDQFYNNFDRDLQKLILAFSTMPSSSVACGNWSQGNLGNNIHLKFFQLHLAASIVKKNFLYCINHNDDLDQKIGELYEFSMSKSVREMIELYRQTVKNTIELHGEGKLNSIDLFDFMINGVK